MLYVHYAPLWRGLLGWCRVGKTSRCRREPLPLRRTLTLRITGTHIALCQKEMVWGGNKTS